MPLYEYECTSCHRRTEKIQKFSDPELTVCPHCGGPLERTITAAAMSFKGGGWYKDGYASAKPAATEGSGGGRRGNASSGEAAAGSGRMASPAIRVRAIRVRRDERFQRQGRVRGGISRRRRGREVRREREAGGGQRCAGDFQRRKRLS